MSLPAPLEIPEKPLDLLVVAPHPDDAEISVGGSIAKAVAEGLHVGILDLTTGEPTPNGSNQRRIEETAAATEALGIGFRGHLGLPNRRVENDLASRRRLAEAFRLLRPRVIFAPYWEDVHPDHVAASQLVDAARFWAKLSRSDLAGERFWPNQVFYYWSIHLRNLPQPSVVIDISDVIETKMRAVECFASQLKQGRDEAFPTVLDDIRDRARYWGWSIQAGYGEPLACREQIPARDLTTLINAFD